MSVSLSRLFFSDKCLATFFYFDFYKILTKAVFYDKMWFYAMKYRFTQINTYIWQMAISTIRINITPQTHVRTTQGDRMYFRIPRDKLRPAGLKRLLRIERYNQYKIDLLSLCKAKGFVLPCQGLCITYYIPVPKSWSEKKKKMYHGILHQNTPDLDNLVKATFDSLVREDKFVGHLGGLCKRWVNFPIGWIEFEIMPPALIEKSIKEINLNALDVWDDK